MSNQTATLHRVTLLESIEAARRSIIVAMEFHKQELYANRGILALMCFAETDMNRAAIKAAQREAWGDGP
jgi:hypothetical protein